MKHGAHIYTGLLPVWLSPGAARPVPVPRPDPVSGIPSLPQASNCDGEKLTIFIGN